MTAYLLLAALTWAVAARGGTGVRDLAVVLALLLVAMVAGRAWPRRDVVLWAAFAALMLWLLFLGPISSGLTLESVRVPLLVVIAALTALVVSRMPAKERDILVTGVILVGCLQSVIALVELAASVLTEPSLAPRAAALLGSPNGLGFLLVATLALTTRELDRHGGWLPVSALLLQTGALVATASRSAILAASILAVWYLITHAGLRRAWPAAAALLLGGAVVIWRTVSGSHEDRPSLWREAVQRIVEHPLAGEGPAPHAFSSDSPGARITTHAHNEVLQWGVEYGLVGVGLALAVIAIAFRSVRRPIGPDRWLQLAAAALLLGGLTDFTLRITALTIAAAALVALALTEQRPAQRQARVPARSAAR